PQSDDIRTRELAGHLTTSQLPEGSARREPCDACFELPGRATWWRQKGSVLIRPLPRFLSEVYPERGMNTLELTPPTRARQPHRQGAARRGVCGTARSSPA